MLLARVRFDIPYYPNMVCQIICLNYIYFGSLTFILFYLWTWYASTQVHWANYPAWSPTQGCNHDWRNLWSITSNNSCKQYIHTYIHTFYLCIERVRKREVIRNIESSRSVKIQTYLLRFHVWELVIILQNK